MKKKSQLTRKEAFQIVLCYEIVTGGLILSSPNFVKRIEDCKFAIGKDDPNLNKKKKKKKNGPSVPCCTLR
jgi:hypothetical protein